MRFMNLLMMCDFVNVIRMDDVCISCIELGHICVGVSLDTCVRNENVMFRYWIIQPLHLGLDTRLEFDIIP